MTPTGKLAVAGLAVTAFVLASRSRRVRAATVAPAVVRTASPQVQNPPKGWDAWDGKSTSGLVVDDKGIRIDDWGRWMAFAPKALRQVAALGVRGAEGMLTHIMARARPDLVWPPYNNSPLQTDWQAMVRVIDAELSDPDPTPRTDSNSGTRPNFRVVR